MEDMAYTLREVAVRPRSQNFVVFIPAHRGVWMVLGIMPRRNEHLSYQAELTDTRQQSVWMAVGLGIVVAVLEMGTFIYKEKQVKSHDRVLML